MAGGSSRVRVLVNQIAHVAQDVQRSAVQELSLLASTSDHLRLSILGAGGDRSLMKLVHRTDSHALLRWGCATLSALAVDDWSRCRQTAIVERTFALCASGADDASPEQQLMVLEAASLLANLLNASDPRTAYERLGGFDALYGLASSGSRSASLIKTLQKAGLEPRGFSAPVQASRAPLGQIKHAPPTESTLQESADEAVAAAVRVQASIRGRQARARKAGSGVAPEVSAALEVEAAAADEAAKAAIRVQASIRGRQVRGRKKEAAEPEASEAAVAIDAEAANAVADAVDEQVEAAVRVQASIRGRQSRAKKAGSAVAPEAVAALEAEAEAADEAVKAAIRMQANVRGRQVRGRKKQVDAPESEPDIDADKADEQVAAAVRVQASIRGRQSRARKAGSAAAPEFEAALAVEAAEADEAVKAAIRVQASVRGQQVRGRKNEAQAPASEPEAAIDAEAADEAVEAAVRVQASIRGRQARAKRAQGKGLGSVMGSSEPAPELQAALEAEAAAADEAVKAAIRVQASVRGRNVRGRRNR